MAQALGYVTKNEGGNFSGTLNLGGASRINIVSNDNKETEKQPDFRIVDTRGQEIGGGWIKTGKVSGNEYISLTFTHPTLGPGKSMPISARLTAKTRMNSPSCGTRKRANPSSASSPQDPHRLTLMRVFLCQNGRRNDEI